MNKIKGLPGKEHYYSNGKGGRGFGGEQPAAGDGKRKAAEYAAAAGPRQDETAYWLRVFQSGNDDKPAEETAAGSKENAAETGMAAETAAGGAEVPGADKADTAQGKSREDAAAGVAATAEGKGAAAESAIPATGGGKSGRSRLYKKNKRAHRGEGADGAEPVRGDSGNGRKGGRNPDMAQNNYAAIDLGTNSCRLVIATPTTTSFRVVETYSKVVRLGEGIIQDNNLAPKAMRRTIQALKVCRGVIDEYMPIAASRFVATAACRRAKNVAQFVEMAKREAGIELEVISSKEEARLSVVGCLPLLTRNIKRVLVFDIGGGSTQISLARVTDSGKTFIEGFVSLPYGVVTISEAFAGHEMSTLEYSTVVERTQAILQEFEDKYHIRQAIANQEIQVIGTSGTVTVIGAVHLRLPRYNRSAVDGIAISAPDIEYTINKIKTMGVEGRCKHPCIGQSKSDLTIAGCAVIEALTTFWPISEITVADRGIREGILLDMMHARRVGDNGRKKRRGGRFPFDRRSGGKHSHRHQPRG